MTFNSSKYAVGIFPSREITEQAIEDLKASGFPMHQISVLLKDSENAEPINRENLRENPLNRSERLRANAVQGAAAGGLLTRAGGIAALLLPGTGLILAAESVMAVLLGTTAVAASGGLVGVLRGLFVPEQQAKYYDDRVTHGEYLVGIEGTEAETARAEEILSRWGIQDWNIFARPER